MPRLTGFPDSPRPALRTRTVLWAPLSSVLRGRAIVDGSACPSSGSSRGGLWYELSCSTSRCWGGDFEYLLGGDTRSSRGGLGCRAALLSTTLYMKEPSLPKLVIGGGLVGTVAADLGAGLPVPEPFDSGWRNRPPETDLYASSRAVTVRLWAWTTAFSFSGGACELPSKIA